MKPLTVFLCIMVTLSLVFSIAAFAIVAQNNGFFTSYTPSVSPTQTATKPPINNEPTPFITNMPTTNPTTAPSDTALTISYTETSRQNKTNDMTLVTLSINAQYKSGSEISIDYSQFYLQVVTFRVAMPFGAGQPQPNNSGTLTIGPSHATESFQLTFQYPTTAFNGMGIANTVYMLEYNGTETVNWTDRQWR